jgi:hypothetical protein
MRIGNPLLSPKAEGFVLTNLVPLRVRLTAYPKTEKFSLHSLISRAPTPIFLKGRENFSVLRFLRNRNADPLLPLLTSSMLPIDNHKES